MKAARQNLPRWPLPSTERGPNGRSLCRCGCRQEVPKGRRTWATPDCIERVRLTCDWSVVKRHVYERDRGICQTCGCHPESIRAEVREALANGDLLPLAEARAEGWPRVNRVWYEIDHEVPVCEGGAELGRKNLRNQCYRCHKVRSKAQAAARREAKKTALQGSSTPPTLSVIAA